MCRFVWERACPRWRRISQPRCRLTHRYRGQARSHINPVSTERLMVLSDQRLASSIIIRLNR
ncbi:hypothetical protein D7M10_17490 [Pseudomonas fluorescens]|nr:hypothetical protein D7M10_17490 [Pseudomonas fluorescens]